MIYAENYTNTELMAAIVANQIRNDDVAIIGMGIPIIAGVVAVNSHAPEATIVFESGGIGARSRRIPWGIADNPTAENALASCTMYTVLSDCQRGFISLAVIGGAEIDRYGNLNSSVIPGADGSYARPKVRFPGSGGANDLASSARRTVIMIRLQKGKFVERVSFITSLGYLSGPGERERLGLQGTGPTMVVTDKCIFLFDKDTKEMYLHSLFPGVTIEQVKSLVNWDLKVARYLSVVEPPTEDQIKVMRSFDPMGIILGKNGTKGQRLEDFDIYYESMKQSYSSK